ncbi:hypothetical protein BDP27DRAFT_562522 [Rhodocollybia butyracea]|uniref:Secreted protein n=1 Tax=Rhodocollybia butyracea TaxID=206335 RepID=A0A9P5P7C9_9AGAR|nr:hypothetical protein BDP27DRAFT_562522 [Rhodocollybia butyracea]
MTATSKSLLIGLFTFEAFAGLAFPTPAPAPSLPAPAAPVTSLALSLACLRLFKTTFSSTPSDTPEEQLVLAKNTKPLRRSHSIRVCPHQIREHNRRRSRHR